MPWTEQKSGTLPISDIVLLFILLVLPGEAQIIVYVSTTLGKAKLHDLISVSCY